MRVIFIFHFHFWLNSVSVYGNQFIEVEALYHYTHLTICL